MPALWGRACQLRAEPSPGWLSRTRVQGWLSTQVSSCCKTGVGGAAVGGRGSVKQGA